MKMESDLGGTWMPHYGLHFIGRPGYWTECRDGFVNNLLSVSMLTSPSFSKVPGLFLKLYLSTLLIASPNLLLQLPQQSQVLEMIVTTYFFLPNSLKCDCMCDLLLPTRFYWDKQQVEERVKLYRMVVGLLPPSVVYWWALSSLRPKPGPIPI